MNRDRIIDEYFTWLYNLTSENRYSDNISYKKLLMHLHYTEFRYLMLQDRNRAEDGMELRYRFAITHDYDREEVNEVLAILDRPCTVFEMMVALAVRCEETIMDDPSKGDRTGYWFWKMIVNLGLGSVLDHKFDKRLVDEKLNRFLERDYEPDGKGGLFRIRDCDRDLRTVEIWHQLCWYLDSIM